jgi:hypothetical protein
VTDTITEARGPIYTTSGDSPVVPARLRRLQRLPHLVRGFFADPELACITAVA